MSNLHSRNESHTTARIDRVLLAGNESIYSYSLEGDKTLMKIIHELNYEKILIGNEADHQSDILDGLSIDTIKKTPLNKRKTYIEIEFNKNDLTKEVEFIKQLYIMAETNDLVYFVLNPAKNKKYYESSTGKVILNMTCKEESIFWFEYDATDLYFVRLSN